MNAGLIKSCTFSSGNRNSTPAAPQGVDTTGIPKPTASIVLIFNVNHCKILQNIPDMQHIASSSAGGGRGEVVEAWVCDVFVVHVFFMYKFVAVHSRHLFRKFAQLVGIF